eukprot:11180146-Lingulodinium_polyedra.AAC.1
MAEIRITERALDAKPTARRLAAATPRPTCLPTNNISLAKGNLGAATMRWRATAYSTWTNFGGPSNDAK